MTVRSAILQGSNIKVLGSEQENKTEDESSEDENTKMDVWSD